MAQKHCDFLTLLEDTFDDMNDPKSLRELLKNEACVLAATVQQCKSLKSQIKDIH